MFISLKNPKILSLLQLMTGWPHCRRVKLFLYKRIPLPTHIKKPSDEDFFICAGSPVKVTLFLTGQAALHKSLTLLCRVKISPVGRLEGVGRNLTIYINPAVF